MKTVASLMLSLLLTARASAGGMPRVMVLVDEKNLGSIPTSEVEAMAVKELLNRGFAAVDQEMVRANLAKQQILLKSVGDVRGAAALGQQFGADVVIVGEAVAKPSARRIAESNLRTYQAVVTLRAVRCDNSENIASASQESSVIALEDVSGGSKSLRQAAQSAIENILDQIQVHWSKTADALSRIVVTVGGIDQAWKLKAVRDQLRGLKEVVNCRQKSYSAGVAIFELETETPAEALSERIVLTADPALSLQVLEVSPAAMQFRAVEKGGT